MSVTSMLCIARLKRKRGAASTRLSTSASFTRAPVPAMSKIRLFVGCVAEAGVGEIHGLDSEQEDILVHAIPRSEAIAMMDADRINNGHTLIALQWLARHGDALRERWLSERHGAC
jgi:ADP-ribose pyrophosphatase